MAQTIQAPRIENEKRESTPLVAENVENGSLPPLKYSTEDTVGWITIDEPIIYVLAGKGPYIGR